MKYANVLKALLLVLSVTSMAMAQTVPDNAQTQSDNNVEGMFGGGGRGPGGPGGGPGRPGLPGNPGGGFGGGHGPGGGGIGPRPMPQPPAPRPEPPRPFPQPPRPMPQPPAPRPEPPRPFPQPPRPMPQPPAPRPEPPRPFPQPPRPIPQPPRPQPPVPQPPRPIPQPPRPTPQPPMPGPGHDHGGDHGGHFPPGPGPGHPFPPGPGPGHDHDHDGHHGHHPWPAPPPPYYHPAPPPYYYPPTPAPYYPPAPAPAPLPPPPSYSQETKRVTVARAVKDESLPLRVLAGIGPEYANWEVVSVTGNTRPNSPARTTATLIANGRALATQVNPGSRINLIPSRRLTLGELNLGDMQLAIGGSTYIDSLEIELRYDQSKVVVIDINDTAANNDVIDLGDFDEVVRNTGRSVDQVLITATSPDNSGSILVVMNGAAVGQTSFTSQVQEQALYVDQEQLLNNGDWATSLYTSGNLSIQKVTLILK